MLQGGSYIDSIAPPFCSDRMHEMGMEHPNQLSQGECVLSLNVPPPSPPGWRLDQLAPQTVPGLPAFLMFEHKVKGTWFSPWFLGGEEKWPKLGMATMFTSSCSYDLRNSQPYLINQIVWPLRFRRNSPPKVLQHQDEGTGDLLKSWLHTINS